MSNHSISDEALGARWRAIDWKTVDARIEQMLREISTASRDGSAELLRSLSEAFLDSFDVKARAVKSVTDNDATDNPGVGEAWKTDADRMRAVAVLEHRGYRTEPFYTFVMFEPKTKKNRTMCIPTYYDRAIHQMYLMLMEAVCEPLYDKRLFSSRRGRSLADAACEVRRIFSGPEAPRWVVRCDIKSFYDTMPHDKLLERVPMDPAILEQFLKAPRVGDNGEPPRPAETGSPTGNRLSPVLANMILNGLEEFMRNPDDPDSGITVRWVDDIVVTATSHEDALRNMAHVRNFIYRLGMKLNEKKSYIAKVSDGFEFLKYRYVRVGDGIRMTPTDEAISDMLHGIEEAISGAKSDAEIVKKVGNRVRGFSTKYRVADLEGCAERIDGEIVRLTLRKLAAAAGLSEEEALKRYVIEDRGVSRIRSNDGTVMRMVSDVVLIDYAPLALSANPYIDTDYFEEKAKRDRIDRVADDECRAIWASTGGCCAVCGLRIRKSDSRTIAEYENRKAYVHARCAEEAETFGGGVVFLPSAFDRPDEKRYRPVSSERCDASEPNGPPPAEPVGVPTEEGESPVRNSEGPVEPEPTGKTSEPERKDLEKPLDLQLLERLATDPARQGNIVFRTKRGTVSKYQPLLNYIQNRDFPYLGDLSFKAVSDLVGGLCSSAYKEREWWFRKGRASIGEALAVIGWEVDTVDVGKQKVVLCPVRIHYEVPEEAYRSRHFGKDTTVNIAERDIRAEKSPFGKLTVYLLGSGLDQIRMSFDMIEVIIDSPLSNYARTDFRYWSNRKPGSVLTAIEDGDFMKVNLDMKKFEILIARTCCVPDPSKDVVSAGELPLKDYMKP